MQGNLYPPIVDTYTPAFVNTKSCDIHFKLSPYNSIDQISSIQNNKIAQVIIQEQNTNEIVSNSPTGIIFCNIKKDEEHQDYYIQLDANNFINNKIKNNIYYKVQIRFASTDVQYDNENLDYPKEDWINNNLSFFSEWSKICLIRGISQPILEINNMRQEKKDTVLIVNGKLIFKDSIEKEQLQSYHLQLYNNSQILLADSGILYTNSYINPNEINYTFPYILEDGASYVLKIQIETNDLYTLTTEYSFQVLQDTLNRMNIELKVLPKEEMGVIQIDMAPTIPNNYYTGDIIIRRASSKTNFKIWEDIEKIHFTDALLKYTWEDTTVESGVWYRYGVQKYQDSEGQEIRGIVTLSDKPEMIVFEDMFLNSNNQQLNIQFNPQITAYKRNVIESKIDTIGSKYPFIKRNNAINYKQFNISGLITTQTDNEDSFNSKEKIYKNLNLINLYNNYNKERNISEYNDYIFERDFREQVINFLYNDKVKLLRTTTEGNILVKLMNINLTPISMLGRIMYSFSATAYEVADNELKNYKFYNIYNYNEKKDPEQQEGRMTIGQIYNMEITSTSENILDRIMEKHCALNYYQLKRIEVDYLSKVKISFLNAPQLLYYSTHSKQLEPVTKSNKTEAMDTILGYLIDINNVRTYINPEGILTLGKDIKIKSLSFPAPSKINLDYCAKINIQDELIYKNYYSTYKIVVGQLHQNFSYDQSIHNIIKDKYQNEYSTFDGITKLSTTKRDLLSINAIGIETNPGTIGFLQNDNDEITEFIINETGTLYLYNEDFTIKDVYFKGIQMEPATNEEKNRVFLPYNKYILIKEKYSDLNAIIEPKLNYVYNIENSYQIYYNNQWFNFNLENNQIICPTFALIDYCCEVMEGEVPIEK